MNSHKTITALRESVFGVILVRIFPAFSRIWTEYGYYDNIYDDNICTVTKIIGLCLHCYREKLLREK